jgi:ribosomal protein L12E/L44/L45/RPP1/RPP2
MILEEQSMANLSHKDVVSAFEKRYDHQSARNVLNQALNAGGLTAKDAYSDAEVAKIGEALKALGERMIDTIVESLGTGGAPAPAPKEDKAKEEPKEEAKAKPKEDKAKDKGEEKAEDKKGDDKGGDDKKK